MNFFLNIINLISANIEQNFLLTFLFIFIFLLVYNSLSIPGNMILFASTGYFFGIYIGFFISITSLVFGSFVFFSFSHFFIKNFSFIKKNKYFIKLHSYIPDSNIEYLIILRIIPGPPIFIQNILLSFFNISKIKFIISTFLGFTPLVFIVVYMGSQLKNLDQIKDISVSEIFTLKFLAFIFFVFLLLLIKIYYNRIKN